MSERLELTPSVGSRVAIGLILFMLLVPIVLLGGAIGAIISVVLVAGFIALCVAMGKRRLVIDERGVTAKGMTSVRRIEWDEVDHYTFWSMDPQAVYAAGGQGAIGVLIVIAIVAIVRKLRKNKNANRRFAQGRLTLVTGGGKVTIPVDARYKNVGEALDRLFAELHPRLRERAADLTNFAPFTLTDTELTHDKKGTLGLGDVQHVGAASARITIKKRDKTFAWANVSMKKIRNVMLFLEVVAERGLVVKANPEVFMPPTVVDKLRAAASRQAAMPQARVVSR